MKVLTANRLIDGESVWYASGPGWLETLAGAEVVTDKDGEARLEAIGKASFDANEVVDVNLIDVEQVDGVLVPQRMREKIRATGPTIRLDLGKQARPSPKNDPTWVI